MVQVGPKGGWSESPYIDLSISTSWSAQFKPIQLFPQNLFTASGKQSFRADGPTGQDHQDESKLILRYTV